VGKRVWFMSAMSFASLFAEEFDADVGGVQDGERWLEQIFQ